MTTVEFISWNTARRKFDFGVIENMGGDGEPELKVLDGVQCFSCHKNRGPILGDAPWSNTAHDDILRLSAAGGPATERERACPRPGHSHWGRPPGEHTRTGSTVRRGDTRGRGGRLRGPTRAHLRLNRDIFRLMTRTPDGQGALVILLAAVVGPGPLDSNDKSVKQALDAAFERSFLQFAADWVELQKEARPNMLIDIDPASLLEASGVRPDSPAPIRPTQVPVVRVPGLVGGSGSRWAAPRSPAAQAAAAARAAAAAQKAIDDLSATLVELNRYESARSAGSHGLTSKVQPSNPRAFFKPPVKAAQRPSGMVGTVMLASTIGLTEGDRKFLATTLADAAKRVNTPKATAATLARSVFEGPEFAELLAGGPLPDRDEFKTASWPDSKAS